MFARSFGENERPVLRAERESMVASTARSRCRLITVVSSTARRGSLAMRWAQAVALIHHLTVGTDVVHQADLGAVGFAESGPR